MGICLLWFGQPTLMSRSSLLEGTLVAATVMLGLYSAVMLHYSGKMWRASAA